MEEVEEDKKDEEAAPWDVAAILERYQVLHSEEDTSSDEEIQDWDDFDDIWSSYFSSSDLKLGYLLYQNKCYI